MPATVRMFVNGQAMSGGSLHGALSEARFCGEVRTAARYRFLDFGEFPGLLPDDEAGAEILGELYEVDYEHLRERLLPNEPPELELSVIELAGGEGSCSMIVRAAAASAGIDITGYGGWRAFRTESGVARPSGGDQA